MQPFICLRAVALPLFRGNIDTDAIIPSREMKSVSKTGLADGLFAGWRYTAPGGREPNPEFVLNHAAYTGARILLGGENFGCGSSREHAVWALAEYGFRAIVAPSFAPIFAGNCARNGILNVTLTADRIAMLAAGCAADPQQNLLAIDLPNQSIGCGAHLRFPFAIDAESKQMLLAGLDAIDLTLTSAHEIRSFIDQDRTLRPWIYPVARPPHEPP